MSDYRRTKAVFYPVEGIDFTKIYGEKVTSVSDLSWRADALKDYFSSQSDFAKENGGHFDTEYFCDYNTDGECRAYLTFVKYSSYGDESSDFGRARYLTESEKEKYKKLFELILPDIDAAKLKYIDYCFYNCSECEDYYIDRTAMNDEFYREI